MNPSLSSSGGSTSVSSSSPLRSPTCGVPGGGVSCEAAGLEGGSGESGDVGKVGDGGFKIGSRFGESATSATVQLAKRNPPKPGQTWVKRRSESTSTASRAKLSEDDLKLLAQKMRERFRWSEDPRFFQLEGTKAQLEGVDMIIQAPTGSGKTAIAAGPHVWPASKGKVTLMVCPLLALEDEMVDTFKTDFDLTAVAINSKTGACNPKLVKELLAGAYQIVLISPEMLQSRPFIDRVLRRPAFSRQVLSVVIDEAHCVSHWGSNFRKKYASLGVIRAFLPRHTPIIAVTATLTARVRHDLHHKLHFPKTGSRFINMGNDRPNVSVVVRAIEHPQNSYTDLDFVLPAKVDQAGEIPKTYIYVDNIRVGGEIIDHLNGLLAERNPSLTGSGLIRPYNATLSHEYRLEAMNAFRRSSNESGHAEDSHCTCIRILVCTDAAGMGCNVSDVDVVVQWKLPGTLSHFVQRAGRAARGRERTGLAVLLVERTAYSTNIHGDSSVSMEKSTSNKMGRRKQGAKVKVPKDYAQDHGVNRGGTKKQDDLPKHQLQPQPDPEAPDEGLLAFVQTGTCRRKVWASVFESETKPLVPGVPCCDICDASLFDRTRPGTREVRAKQKLPARGKPDRGVQNNIDDWRAQVLLRDHAHAQFDVTAILDDNTVAHLSSVGPLLARHVSDILQGTWLWWDKYGAELSTFLTQQTIIYTPLPKKSKAAIETAGTSASHATSVTPHPKRSLSLEEASSQVANQQAPKRTRISTFDSDAPSLLAEPIPDGFPRTPARSSRHAPLSPSVHALPSRYFEAPPSPYIHTPPSYIHAPPYVHVPPSPYVHAPRSPYIHAPSSPYVHAPHLHHMHAPSSPYLHVPPSPSSSGPTSAPHFTGPSAHVPGPSRVPASQLSGHAESSSPVPLEFHHYQPPPPPH